ncbi:MAG: hypothetical protein FWE35_07330 [Streptosporangiales bacterium]|nr:hypothetical protein [Streptosporangiales bacterium]
MTTVPVAHAAFPYVPVVFGGLLLIALAVLVVSWIRRGHRIRAIITVGCVVIVVALLGSFIVWRHRQDPVRGLEANRAQEAKLSRLGFPLELPRLPGYFPMAGIVLPGDALTVGYGRGARADLADGQSSVLSVNFYRPSMSEGASDLSECVAGGPRSRPRFTCQAEGPGLWRVTAPGMPYHEVIARKPDMIVVVRGDAGAQVPDSVLLQAVTSLRPATAAQIANLAQEAMSQ